MSVRPHHSGRPQIPFSLTVLLLLSFLVLSCPELFGQDDPDNRTFLRYRLHRAREAALEQQNERVLLPLLSASRRLAADWNSIPDADKLTFVAKCEEQLGLAKIDRVPDGVAESAIPFAVARREFLDVAFADIAGVDPKLLSLDIYAPRDNKPHPVVVWYHGGGMSGGDKGHPVISLVKADFFVARGFVFVSVNYRLAPKYKFPSPAQDAATAVAFLHDHIDEFGGDRQRLYLIGNSAGGQLVSILATNHSYLHALQKSPAVIAGVVVLDIGSFDIPSILDQLGNRAPRMYFDAFEPKRQDWIDASPLFHVAAGKPIPRMLLIYVDGREHHRQENMRFAEKMKKHGHSATVFAAKDRTHNSLAMRIGTTDDPATEQIMAFFQLKDSRSQQTPQAVPSTREESIESPKEPPGS